MIGREDWPDLFGVDSLWLLSFLVSLLLGSQASVSFSCWVLLFSLLFIAAVRVMASSSEMILILVIVMEGEDAIVVAAVGGGLSFWQT